ncbi:rubrerythrin [Thermococcus profundus]|uniref:Rubrerythrin n=1 Tax=Thermococcus profundus TaxID=49899 RepID=A0A2Z2MB38_THEPR|nr:ferritin family protein [Thermococcus profundus]ASJ02683.1 rubrerythrin [Thermococcus profundus]
MPTIEDRELDEYLEEVVEKLKSLSFKEALSYAIFDEEGEADYYARLSKKAKRPSIKVLFIQMSDESRNHRNKLYALFKKVFPDEEPVKVEAPPVEVVPFYTEFEKVEDYLKALEYCMESELFAKRAYEILSEKAVDEDARGLFVQLSIMEHSHYERIKKAYEMVLRTKRRRLIPGELEAGGYLFTDKIKARYFFLDLIGEGNGVVITREHPKKLRSWMKREVPVLWLSEGTLKATGVRVMSSKLLLTNVETLAEWVKSEGFKVILLEGVEYLLLDFEERELIKFVLLIRDLAIENGFYLVVSAEKEAFTPTNWAILQANMEGLV